VNLGRIAIKFRQLHQQRIQHVEVDDAEVVYAPAAAPAVSQGRW